MGQRPAAIYLYQIARLFSDGDAAQYHRDEISPPKRTFDKLSRRMMVNDIRRDHQPANQGRRFHKVGLLHPVKESREEVHQEQDSHDLQSDRNDCHVIRILLKDAYFGRRGFSHISRFSSQFFCGG